MSILHGQARLCKCGNQINFARCTKGVIGTVLFRSSMDTYTFLTIKLSAKGDDFKRNEKYISLINTSICRMWARGHKRLRRWWSRNDLFDSLVDSRGALQNFVREHSPYAQLERLVQLGCSHFRLYLQQRNPSTISASEQPVRKDYRTAGEWSLRHPRPDCLTESSCLYGPPSRADWFQNQFEYRKPAPSLLQELLGWCRPFQPWIRSRYLGEMMTSSTWSCKWKIGVLNLDPSINQVSLYVCMAMTTLQQGSTLSHSGWLDHSALSHSWNSFPCSHYKPI